MGDDKTNKSIRTIRTIRTFIIVSDYLNGL